MTLLWEPESRLSCPCWCRSNSLVRARRPQTDRAGVSITPTHLLFYFPVYFTVSLVHPSFSIFLTTLLHTHASLILPHLSPPDVNLHTGCLLQVNIEIKTLSLHLCPRTHPSSFHLLTSYSHQPFGFIFRQTRINKCNESVIEKCSYGTQQHNV